MHGLPHARRHLSAGVWDFVDGKAVVAAKLGCIVGCSHYATLCEEGAISFPTIDDLRGARRGE